MSEIILPKDELIDRLNTKFIIDNNGCWNFTGVILDGYGYLTFKNKMYRVHRLSAYIYLDNPMDSDLFVLHKCDNRRCFNPAHLFLGTHSDNMKDSVAKGTHKESRKTHCKSGHEFNYKNTSITNLGKRRCLVCARIYDAKRRPSVKK